MKKSVAMRWVNALRSGNYKQGKFALRDDDTYCCLGVLCEITKKQTGGKWDAEGRFSKLHDRDEAGLPSFVQAYAGMKSYQGELPDRIKSLADLNDSHGYGFKRIAAIIEKYWKDL